MITRKEYEKALNIIIKYWAQDNDDYTMTKESEPDRLANVLFKDIASWKTYKLLKDSYIIPWETEPTAREVINIIKKEGIPHFKKIRGMGEIAIKELRTITSRKFAANYRI